MKVLSDPGSPSCVLTNAEFLSFARRAAVRDKEVRNKIFSSAAGPDRAHAAAVQTLPRDPAAKITAAVVRYIRASPAGGQSVGACVRVRQKLREDFAGVIDFTEEEIVQICNMRAGHSDVLERIMPQEKVLLLSQETWDAVLGVIDECLEPRV